MRNSKLYKGFIGGDEQSFRELYRDFSAMVFGVAMRYTRCKDDAQDVLQETFIKVYEKRKSYNTTFPIAPWIKKIAVNTALMYIRTNYKSIILTNDDEQFDRMAEENIQSESISDLKKKLLTVLTRLPDGYRIVFNLFVIDNLTHIEIASYLNISESTSRSQLHKAKKMISEILKKDKV